MTGGIFALCLAAVMLLQGVPSVRNPAATLRFVRSLPKAVKFFFRGNVDTMTVEDVRTGGWLYVVFACICVTVAILSLSGIIRSH